MAYKKIQIHGPGVSTQGENPKIWVNVTTSHTGWSGTKPLYKVTISLAPLEYSASYFGYALKINMNGSTKTLKENSPSQWSDGYGEISFTNVPYGTKFTITSNSTGCGCGTWKPKEDPKYDSKTWTNPSTPGSQKINGVTTATVTERSDKLTLTWTKPSGGTGGISGYKIYYSIGTGWKHFKTVNSDTLSLETTINDVYKDLKRGTSLGFLVTAYNSASESSKPSSAQIKATLANVNISLTKSNITPIQATINWESNINIKTVEWRVASSNTWKSVSTNLNAKKGSFIANGLSYNTTYSIQVRLTAKSDSAQASTSISVTTLDIARITKYPAEWSVEDSIDLTITNPGNCGLQLYISYNNVEVISRTNITLNNNIYKLTLTDTEKNMLYSQASSDNAPVFKLILKSYINNKIGEDVKTTKITFPTKAWVKINNSWKRALVWSKVDSTWRQCVPWVKVSNTWKRI